jgi:large subunit ribosomal protein L9
VTNHDVAEAMQALSLDVAKAQVRMPNGPLKAAGEYTVNVHLHTDVEVEVSIHVIGDAA